MWELTPNSREIQLIDYFRSKKSHLYRNLLEIKTVTSNITHNILSQPPKFVSTQLSVINEIRTMTTSYIDFLLDYFLYTMIR